ncbi:MAG: hypothetical protein EON95_18665 [Caulobacteraceae bacterium]|nr:MAG: hypothetical protein EON95_18665 [Caulobacteraceae bacterium]
MVSPLLFFSLLPLGEKVGPKGSDEGSMNVDAAGRRLERQSLGAGATPHPAATPPPSPPRGEGSSIPNPRLPVPQAVR